MPAEAEEAWWEFFGHLNAPSLREQITAAERRLADNWAPEVQKQLILLKTAQAAVLRGEQSDDD